MAYANKTLKKVYDKLCEIPDIYFDIGIGGNLALQTRTNTGARRIRKLFPKSDWKRSYDSSLKWWEWRGEWEGIKIHIYAIKETPNDCQAITETRTVTKRIPIEFDELEVEETVIVGWDCKATANQENK